MLITKNQRDEEALKSIEQEMEQLETLEGGGYVSEESSK